MNWIHFFLSAGNVYKSDIQDLDLGGKRVTEKLYQMILLIDKSQRVEL